MDQPILSKTELASFFGVSEDRIRQQYQRNAVGLKKMYDKAVASGNKVNGYSAEQLLEMKDRYSKLAKS